MTDVTQSFRRPISESGVMETRLRFTLNYWCLWQSVAASTNGCWPGGEVLPLDQASADVSFLPMMQRRRLSPLARAACAVAWRCRQQSGDMPSVFFSRHGESQYYYQMLEGISDGESVSPSRFSLCVHNAIAGQYSIQSESFQPYVSLAGGTEGMFAAFLEASGMLLETPKVLTVWYEQPLPKAYQTYTVSPETTWALAMVLSRADQPGQQLRLARISACDQTDPQTTEPDMIQAILDGRLSGQSHQDRSLWRWSLDDV